MKLLSLIKELDELRNLHASTNMLGKTFNYEQVRQLCRRLKEEAPEKFDSLNIEGTDYELMVSVSNFLDSLIKV